MKKWLESYAAILRSLGAFALCFVMLFAVMGAVCLPADAYADDYVDDSGATLDRSNQIEHFAAITIKDSDGNEVPVGGFLDPAKSYIIHFHVHEKRGQGFQTDYGKVDLLFDTEAMYYQLPAGMTYLLNEPKGGRLTLTATDYEQNKDYPVYADVDIIDHNGVDVLEVVWDKTSPGYSLLVVAFNAHYTLQVQATADKNKDVIDFGDGNKFYTDNTAGVNFTKTINTTDADSAAAEELRDLLTEEQKEAFKFTLKQVYVARQGEPNEAIGEFEDKAGFIRNADGSIAYEDPKDITIDLTDMTWIEQYGHYYYEFPQRLKPTNETVMIQETARPESLAGYVWNAQSSVDQATSAEDLTGGSDLTMSLVNTYTEQKAQLRLSKSFAPDSAELSDEQKAKIKFTITGTKANGNPYGPVTLTYDELEKMNWAAITLPSGTYKVTENGAVTNFDWTVTYEASSATTAKITGDKAETGNVVVGSGDTGAFVFTNTYTQHKGSLKLEKHVSGKSLTTDEKKAIKFTIKQDNTTLKWTKNGDNYVLDPNGKVTEIPFSEFKTDGSVNLTGLPVGTYTVVETNPTITGYTNSTTVQVNGGAAANGTSASVSVSNNGTGEVDFNNTYTENGKISLKKTVEGALSLSDVRSKVKFTLQKLVNNQWVDTEYTNLTVNANGELYGEGLPFGTYRIVEHAEAVPNYSMETAITVTPAQGATVDADHKHVTFTLSASNNNVATEFTNTYTPKTGELTLTKTLKGSYPADATSKISFKVQDGTKTLKWTKVTDNEYKYDPNGTITDIPYGASIKLTGLPGGHTYKVTETVGSYSGSYLVSTKANGTTDTKASVELQEGTDGKVNNGTVAFENTYNPIAKIKIDKTFSGVLDNDFVNKKILDNLQFVISKKEGNNTLYLAPNDTWISDKTNAKKFSYTELSTGKELEANETYYIEELNAEVPGFTVTTWWKTGNDNLTQVTGTNQAHVTVTPGQTPTISFNNDYRANGEIIGKSVQLHTKTWAGLTDSEQATALQKVRFELEVMDDNTWKPYDTYTHDELMAGRKTYTDAQGNTVTLDISLPEGRYRLKETNYAVTGYDHELFIIIVQNGQVNYARTELLENKQIEFDVENGSTYQFGLANVYTPKGALQVKKVIEGVDDNNRSKTITFKLSRKLGENGEVVDIETFNLNNFTNGVYTKSGLSTGDYQSDDEGNWTLIPYYYIIEETGTFVENHTLDGTTVKVNNVTVEGEDKTARVQLQKGTTASVTVEFTNTYKRNKGELSIVKNIVGDVPSADANKITFQVKDANNNVVTWDVVDSENVCPDTGNGANNSFTYADMAVVNNQRTFTITNLSTGTYTLVETNADIAGYSRETKFEVGNQSTDKATVETNETAKIEVTNTYNPVGDLKITKKVVINGHGLENTNDPGNFKYVWFDVYKVEDWNRYVTGFDMHDKMVQKLSATEWEFSHTLTNLVPGDYIIVEKNAAVAGYTHTGITVTGAERIADLEPGCPTFKVEVTSNGGTAIEVGLVNNYKEQGELTVKKTFDGIEASKVNEKKDKIVFGLFDASNVLIPAKANDAIADGDYKGWVSYAKMTNGTYTWENLDVNKQYYVKEYIIGEDNANTATGSTFYGYIHTETSWTGATSGSTTAVPGTVQTGNVTVNKNGVQIDFTNTYEQVNPISAEKLGQNFSSAKVDGEVSVEGLPAWHFLITLNNVGAATMNNGTMTITDEFDTQNKEWFKLVEKEGYRPQITIGEGITLTVVDEDTNDGIAQYVLTLQDDAPESQTVTIAYYLQPKNAATFQQMLADKTHKATVTQVDDGKEWQATWVYTNTITYNKMPKETATATANYFYNTDMVTKTIYTNKNDRTVTFTLDINPYALYIGNNDYLVVLDNMSENLELNTSSIVVEPEEEKANVIYESYTGEGDWDFQFRVPNAKALKITYTATIKDMDANVPVTNTVSMEGLIQQVGDNVEFESGNSGSMSVGAISVFKRGDTPTVHLEGAKFALYQCEDSDLNLLDEELFQAEFTTNQYGIALIKEWADSSGAKRNIRFDVLYHLVEISAPDGYELPENDEGLYFRILDPEEGKAPGKEDDNRYVPAGYIWERSNASFKAEVTLQANKTLLGRDLEANQFTFQLLNEDGYVLQEKQNAANGTVTFAPLSSDSEYSTQLKYSYEKFSEEEKERGCQIHKYFIKEVNSGAAGYIYDAKQYEVEVTVSLVKDAGKVTGLEVTPEYFLNNEKVDGAVFTNSYKAEGSVQPTGTKTLENATKINEAFSFQIEGDQVRATVTSPVNENGKTVEIPYPTFKYVVDADATADVVYADGVITTTVNKAEDLASPYIYTIEETNKTINSIEYDNTVYTYTVSVSDADNNGQLTVSGQLSVNDQQLGATEKADFTNTYYGELKITKHVTVGGNPTTGKLADGTYTFTVYTDADCTDIAKDKDDKKLVLELEIEDGADATRTLTGIVPGTYWVKETSELKPGMSVIDNPVRVTVSDDPAIEEKEIDIATITNNLGVANLSLTKMVNGLGQYHSNAHAQKEFSFTVTIEGAEGDYEASIGETTRTVSFVGGQATVSLKAGQTITIKGVQIGAAYTIVETDVPNDGYTPVEESLRGSIDANNTSVTQHNTYEARGEIVLEVSKAVRGNTYKGNEEFTFLLTGDGIEQPKTAACENGMKASFEKIEYTQPGTYTYSIQEQTPNVTTDGMNYNTEAYTVEVVVSDQANGTLAAVAKYDGNHDNLTITNTYHEISFQPEVNKALSGDAPTETYKFQLLDATGTGNVLDIATVTGAGAVVFDEITKYVAGTYTYTIKEVAGDTPGLSYSTDAITYSVVVTENEQTGELIKTETYSGGTGEKNNTLTNTYATVQDTPHVRKSLQGNVDWFDGQETEKFLFTLKRIKAPEGAESFADRNASCTLQEGVASFGEITYKVDGTYRYEIAEIAGQTEGMEYSTEKIFYTVVIEKTASPENKLYVKSATYAGGAGEDKDTITNTYRETSFQLHVGKALTDSMNLYTANENFGFTLSGSGIQPVTQYCQAGNTVVFAPITVYAEGKYEYTITEVNGKTPGMAYDAVAHDVVVTVTEDRDTGAISAVVKYDDNQDTLTITNTYTPVSFTPVINKVLTGDKELYTANETFNFVLIQASEDAVQNPENALTASCTLEQGQAVFAPIVYTQPGEYHYTIQEVIPDNKTAGMHYFTEVINCKVTVSQAENATNALTATAVYTGSNNLPLDTITNKYGETSFTPVVQKVVDKTGPYDLPAETFVFTLTTVLDDGTIHTENKTVTNGETVAFSSIVYHKEGTYTIKITEEEPSDNAVPGKTPGMTYSKETVVYTVVVTCHDDGSLTTAHSCKVGNADSNTITNTYVQPEGEATIQAKKLLSGNVDAYKATHSIKPFKFLLTINDNPLNTVTNNLLVGGSGEKAVMIDQTVSWTIKYDQPGTYEYTIQEIAPTNQTLGMEYDAKVHTVKVEMGYTADKMALEPKSVTYDEQKVDLLEITNKYSRISAQPKIIKKVESLTENILAEVFTFQITEQAETEIPYTGLAYATIVRSDDNPVELLTAEAIFNPITYYAEGSYKYSIVELAPEEGKGTPGMNYSKEVITYTVEILRDQETGELTVGSQTYTNGLDENSNTITNIYDRPDTDAVIQVQKKLSGNPYNGTNKEFEFTLTKDTIFIVPSKTNDVVLERPAQTVKADTDEMAVWSIHYEQPGVYTYTIRETIPAEADQIPGMEYDATEYKVTVSVTYDETGNDLVTEVIYENGETNEAKDTLLVTNKYSEITFNPSVEKVLMGENLLKETFNFILTQKKPEMDDPYTCMGSVTVDSETGVTTGVVPFTTPVYHSEGEYVYEIVEIKPENPDDRTPGMTYSPETIVYTVMVKRNKDTGELTVVKETYTIQNKVQTDTVDASTEGVEGKTFTNVYKRPEGEAQINVTKAMTGNAYHGKNDFEFVLSKFVPVEGAVQTPADSDTNNVIMSEQSQTIGVGDMAAWIVKYDQPGTYYYTIQEINGREIGVEYDETLYYVTVVVDYYQDENGDRMSLVSTVTYGKETNGTDSSLTVTNKYSCVTFLPFVDKKLVGNNLLKETFRFTMKQVGATYGYEASCTVDPEKTTMSAYFSPITYYGPGKYVYEIREEIPAYEERTPGMTYSEEVIVCTVYVTRAANGRLSVSVTYEIFGKISEDGTVSEEAVHGSTFTNVYKRPEGDADIKVAKALTGDAYEGENAFTFTLEKVEPSQSTETNNIIVGELSQIIGVDELAAWTIKYDQPGTYIYAVREVKGDEAGITYDENVYYVTVVMAYSEDLMSLVSTVTYGKEPNGTDSSLTVTNKYSRTGFQPKVKKLVTGDDAPDETFTFQLKNSYGYVDMAKCKGGETAVFKPIVYHGPGVYVYTITELEPENKTPGMTYSDEVIVLTVTVIEADDGTLFISSSYSGGGVITNKYSRIEFVPEIDKIVNGSATRETFTFQLTDGKGYWDTASCKDEEKAVFNPIVYHEPGVYTYTITELEPEYKTPGMTYSDEVIVLTVEVTRAEDGTLSITASYTDGGVITNTYVPPVTYDYKFSFTKKWQGGVEASLEWTLYDTNGNVVHKKFNKDIIDEREWYYEAWFATDKGYYIIEDVPEGYTPIYINVGKYEDVTDRLYNGGTIINYKVPQTGDSDSPAVWMAVMMCSAAAIMLMILRRKREQ